MLRTKGSLLEELDAFKTTCTPDAVPCALCDQPIGIGDPCFICPDPEKLVHPACLEDLKARIRNLL